MSTEVKAEVKVGGISALSAVASEEALQQMREEFAGLTADTKDGYEEVRKAIRVCVKTRTGIDAARKALNEEALKWQRTVNAEAKRLTGEVEKIEAPLVAMKSAVDAEAERQRKELEEKQRAFVNGRLAEYFAICGESCPVEVAENASLLEWAELLRVGGEKHEARKAEAVAKAEAERAERERIEEELKAAREEARIAQEQAAKERAELEALRAEKLAAERKAAEEMTRAEAERVRLAKLEEERKQEADLQEVLKRVAGRKPKYVSDLDNALHSLGNFQDTDTAYLYGSSIDQAKRALLQLISEFEASIAVVQ